MTVEQFIQSTVEGPGALSPEGLAFHEKRVAEAEAALKDAKRLVAVADAKSAALAKKQAAINSRLAELNAAIRDKAGLRAVVADLKAVKAEAARRASLEAEQRLLSEALQLLVAGDLTDAEALGERSPSRHQASPAGVGGCQGPERDSAALGRARPSDEKRS